MGKYKFVQEPQYVETLTWGMYHECNQYHVIQTDDNKTVYTVEELSSIFWRCWCLCKCPPSNRPYEARMYNAHGALVCQVDRPWQCSIMWMCRPEAVVKDTTDTLIGRVINYCPPYLSWNLKVTVLNESDIPEYSLSICICNFHVCCECCIGPWSGTDITITPGDGMDSYNVPISLKKVWSGFGQEWYSAADQYEFDVPDNWHDGQWAKFMTALQLFDMLFFEQYLSCFPIPSCGKCCMPC